MKQKCKTCNNNCEGEYCFRHKPKKQMSKKSSPLNKLDKSKFSAGNTEQISKMKEMFLSIWKKKPHRSEVSNTYLGNEPLTTFFHHILPKNKYPEAALDEENIILLTLQEHDQVEMDIYRYDVVNNKRKILLEKYGK